MPRAVWSFLLLLVLAVAVGSCFDAGDCPTCPPQDSGRIDVLVSRSGTIDSVDVLLDGGPQVRVRRGQRTSFQGLKPGGHQVEAVRWYSPPVRSRSSSVWIVLQRGETRVLVFHNDFPLVAFRWAPDRALLAAERRATWDPAG